MRGLLHLLVLLPLLAPPAAGDPLPRIVLIIDDLGESLAQGRRVLALPGAVTPALLPHTPHAAALARQAHGSGREVMLHLPMSSHNGRFPGRGALSPAMDRETFNTVLERNLAALPQARGVNNHMGSELTEQPLAMGWLMHTLKQRRLYFVDSRTSRHTSAEHQARLQGVPNLRRHVFLDHDPDPDVIAARFEELVTLARRQGVAVGIGHPYPQTLELLERTLPGLALRGVRLAHPGELLATPPPCGARLGWLHRDCTPWRPAAAAHADMPAHPGVPNAAPLNAAPLSAVQ